MHIILIFPLPPSFFFSFNRHYPSAIAGHTSVLLRTELHEMQGSTSIMCHQSASLKGTDIKRHHVQTYASVTLKSFSSLASCWHYVHTKPKQILRFQVSVSRAILPFIYSSKSCHEFILFVCHAIIKCALMDTHFHISQHSPRIRNSWQKNSSAAGRTQTRAPRLPVSYVDHYTIAAQGFPASLAPQRGTGQHIHSLSLLDFSFSLILLHNEAALAMMKRTHRRIVVVNTPDPQSGDPGSSPSSG